jgi:hypothetical protein
MKALELIDKADDRIRLLWITLYTFSYGIVLAMAERQHKCMVLRPYWESLNGERVPKSAGGVNLYYHIDPKEWVLGTYVGVALGLYLLLTLQYRMRRQLASAAQVDPGVDSRVLEAVASGSSLTKFRLLVAAALIPMVSAANGLLEICEGFSPWFGNVRLWSVPLWPLLLLVVIVIFVKVTLLLRQATLPNVTLASGSPS